MITTAAVDVARGLVGFLTGLFPTFTVPDVLIHLDTTVNGFLAQLSGVGAWIPWSWVIASVGIALSCYCACFVVKLILKVAAFVPFFGGSG